MQCLMTLAPEIGRHSIDLPVPIRRPRAMAVPPTAFASTFRLGRVFALADVAERLGISLRQVQAHVADGTLAAINVGRGPVRRDLRVTDEALDDFARRRRLGHLPQRPTRGGPRKGGH